MTFKNLAELVRTSLKRRVLEGDFTESELAHHAGISDTQMRRILAGDRPLTQKLADRIIENLDLSLIDVMRDQLADRKGDNPRQCHTGDPNTRTN